MLAYFIFEPKSHVETQSNGQGTALEFEMKMWTHCTATLSPDDDFLSLI